MKYREELLWILDKPGTTIQNLDEKFRENIDFVHSLGLKCDSVGWCRLDLSDSRTPERFEKIAAFCKENAWRSRCIYTRQYVDFESDWYELVPEIFRENTVASQMKTSEHINTLTIRAFHELSPTPKAWGNDLYVPERFRDFCIGKNWEDLNFCWVRDKGKYEAEQYFQIFGKKRIPRLVVDFEIEANGKRISEAGGWLPGIARTFSTLQQINLPDCYLREDLPEGGIAYGYIPSTFLNPRKHTILIHKDRACELLKEKIIPAKALRPAPVVEKVPGGYTLRKTQPIQRPTDSFVESMRREYDALKAASRPAYKVSEKEALSFLRRVKKERGDDFRKGLPRAKAGELTESEYSRLLPYYLICDGGDLSDEYRLLSYEESILESKAFFDCLKAEELLEGKPDGIVIAKCPDGDPVLLCPDDGVIRFSHEAPETIEQWPGLASFVVDAIES